MEEICSTEIVTQNCLFREVLQEIVYSLHDERYRKKLSVPILFNLKETKITDDAITPIIFSGRRPSFLYI